MPWTPQQFASRHNHSLGKNQAKKAASIANAMIGKGVDEGIAIATANKRAKAKPKAADQSAARARKLVRRGVISNAQYDRFRRPASAGDTDDIKQRLASA